MLRVYNRRYRKSQTFKQVTFTLLSRSSQCLYLTTWPHPELASVCMVFKTLCSIQLTWHLRELRQGHHFFLLPSLLTQTVKELPVCAHSRSEDSHYRAGVFPPYTEPGISHRDTKTWLNKSALLRHAPPSLALLRFLFICFLDIPWL